MWITHSVIVRSTTMVTMKRVMHLEPYGRFLPTETRRTFESVTPSSLRRVMAVTAALFARRVAEKMLEHPDRDADAVWKDYHAPAEGMFGDLTWVV